MAFPPLEISDHVIVSIFIDFSSNSEGNSFSYDIAFNYSHDDWDSLCGHLRSVPWEDIFKLGASPTT